MTRETRADLANSFRYIQKRYRRALDEAHEDARATMDAMHKGDKVTLSTISRHLGVPYQALTYDFKVAIKGDKIVKAPKLIQKRFAEVLPDGRIDITSTMVVSQRKMAYMAVNNAMAIIQNPYKHNLEDYQPVPAIEILYQGEENN